MEKWVWYSIISMFFAGITSIIAKLGLKEISGDLGLAVRTCFVFAIIMTNTLLFDEIKQISTISTKSLMFLALSGLTTSISWIFYYRAIKIGNVSYVASIDKASIVLTIILSFLILKEPITPKILLGATLITSGMFVLIWK